MLFKMCESNATTKIIEAEDKNGNNLYQDALKDCKWLDKNENKNLEKTLKILSSLPITEIKSSKYVDRWTSNSIPESNKLFAIKNGNSMFRVPFIIDGNNIVLLYICKKTGQKADTKDIKKAVSNLKKYKGE